MSDDAGVFLLNNDESIIPLQSAQFVSEDEFQKLLSRFPELLVGGQIDPANPRRWALVKREQAVATNQIGASQWSIDHLFLDQDGIPTLVEIKRQNDTRIRREVVGQMLDYAANCSSYWNIDKLQSDFARTCEEAKLSTEEVLARLIGADQNSIEFWQRVKANLFAGRIRLLFVADKIPIELRRIVEFLNEQMDPAEVLAIELRLFAGSGGVRTLVPTVYGQTSEAAARKGETPAQTWDRTSIRDALGGKVGMAEQEAAWRIIEWMEKGGRGLRFGTGRAGSVAPDLRPIGIDSRPIYLSTDGKLYFQFYAWENRPVFGALDRRRELMHRLAVATGLNFSDADLTRAPSVTLSQIAAAPERIDQLLAELNWMEREVKPKVPS